MTGQTKAEDKTLGGVLSQHYSVDYYQREYVWGTKQVEELMSDFLGRFYEDYEEGHETSQVQGYSRYFLGSYIVSEDERTTYIIDGQQRLTTLTLLLMVLHQRAQKTVKHRNLNMSPYIHSDFYGMNKYNINVPEREEVMENLWTSPGKIKPQHLGSNLVKRYNDLKRIVDQELTDDALPHFCYWVRENVMLVQIKAQSEREAYSIFETMNDRGKPLTPIEMLKGGALSLVDNREERSACQEAWDSAQDRLGKQFDQFVIDLLLAKFATLYPGSTPAGDWLQITKQCHRWFKEKRTEPHVGLRTSGDMVRFLKSFDYYSRLYERTLARIETLTPGYENVSYFAAAMPFAAMPVLMSLIEVDDEHEREKQNLIATYMEIRNARHVWNFPSPVNENTVIQAFLRIMKRLRSHPDHTDVDAIAWVLMEYLANNRASSDFREDRIPVMVKTSKGIKRGIHYLLARMTTFMDVQDGRQNPWNELTESRSRYDIEHILAARYEHNSDMFDSQEELDRVRDSIGALGLLDKSTNSSFNNKPYQHKAKKYAEHNRLLGVLSPGLYREGTSTFENHAGLERLRVEHPQLSRFLHPYDKFGSEEALERTEFLRTLAKIVWDVDRLLEFSECSSFEDLEQLAHSDDLADWQESEAPNRIRRAKPRQIKSSVPGEVVKVEARVKRDTYTSTVYAEANDEGKVRIRQIVGLFPQPFKNAVPPAEALRDDMLNGRIGTITETAPGVFHWRGKTDWVSPSTPLAIVKSNTSSLDDWEFVNER